jgi:hypothetical protein
MNDVQPVIPQLAPQKSYEVAVRLQRDYNRIWAHSPEDLSGKGAHTRAILQEDARSFPVDFREHVVDQKARARDQAPEHPWMFDEVAPKEQDLLRAGRALF